MATKTMKSLPMKHNLSLVVILPCLAISGGSYAEVVQAESKNPI
jgi:hypothetical protein